MTLLKLSYKSLINRKSTTLLTLASIAVSVCLLLSLERIRLAARDSFENTISGTDLIVGARTSPLQLLLYSVFHIGDATNNVSWESYQDFAKNPDTAWTIPISLGDSHRGYRVVGTDHNYFEHYKLSGGKSLDFQNGFRFKNLFETVVGYDVAKTLKYQVGDKIILSHGSDQKSFQDHANQPFTVVGVLKKTGTPVDQSLFVSLEAIEAIHTGWENGAPPHAGEQATSEHLSRKKHNTTQMTAFFMGLKSRIAVLKLQRDINQYRKEPLTAALPGVVLSDLWKSMSFMENTLQLLAMLVFIVSLMSLFLVLITSLKERRREMSILRSLGARPSFIFSLFIFESGFVTSVGILLGFLLATLSLWVAQPIVADQFGIVLNLRTWTTNDSVYMATMFAASLLVGMIPAILAYKNSLADGLTIRV